MGISGLRASPWRSLAIAFAPSLVLLSVGTATMISTVTVTVLVMYSYADCAQLLPHPLALCMWFCCCTDNRENRDVHTHLNLFHHNCLHQCLQIWPAVVLWNDVHLLLTLGQQSTKLYALMDSLGLCISLTRQHKFDMQ